MKFAQQSYLRYQGGDLMAVGLFNCMVDKAGITAVSSALSSGELASGKNVAALENAFKTRFDGRDCVAIGNATLALEIIFEVLGIGIDDEVLSLSFNCLASNSAINNVGARPVWVDLDPETGTMDVEDARAQITSKTKAIVVYHVAGYPADISRLRNLSDEYGLTLIEDANAAWGAKYPDGSAVGSVGDYSVFSFYANRIINGTEGAMVVCPNSQMAQLVRQLRRFGIDETQFRDCRGEINKALDVPNIGRAGTLNNVNAALALSSLKTAEMRLSKIQRNAAELAEGLKFNSNVRIVEPLVGATPSYWVFMVLSKAQNSVLDRLRERKIGRSKLHQPNHIYSGFRSFDRKLPGTEYFSSQMIGLPVGWWVSRQQINEILRAMGAC